MIVESASARLAALLRDLEAEPDEGFKQGETMGQAQSKRRIVLIVEDDAELRRLTTTVLEESELDCGIRRIADRIPTQAGQRSDDCGQPMKAA